MIEKWKTNTARAAIAAAMLGLSGTALAQDATPGQAAGEPAAQSQSVPAAQARLSKDDRKFMQKAAQGGMLEVEASKLAMERASSQQVKDFAKMLLDDHTAANAKLADIARQKGVQLPTTLDDKQRKQLSRLQKLQGEQFDAAYMQHMGIKDHRKDIGEFEKQAASGKDEQLKGFAQETLPTLRKHLSHAQQIGATAGRSPNEGGSASGDAASTHDKQ